LIEKDHLVITCHGGPQPVKFNEVRKIEKSHLPVWKKALIGVGVGCVALMLLMYAALHGGLK